MSPFSLGILGSGHVAASGGSIVGTYIGHAGSSANLTTYTFSGTNIGTASADRTVVVVVNTRGAGDLIDITVGGVSMSIDAESSADMGGGTFHVTAIGSLAVASGSTANIVVTFALATFRCTIFVYTLTGGTVTVDEFDTDGSTGTAASLSLAGGGYTIAGAAGTTSTSFTWSGATEDADVVVETGASVAHAEGGPHTITATASSPNISAAAVTYVT